MDEKKVELTDEEIVKDIERSTGMPNYWKVIVLDLIHRLQDENGKLKTLVAHFEQLEKQLSAEIERLTREKSEDVFNLLDLYEKAEADIHSMEREADGYRETIAELQKQVNELKEELEKAYETERANIRAEIADAGTSCHWCERQTVKEIFTELLKNENVTTTIDRDYWGEEMIISAVLVDKIKEIAKRKGVEVE
jgi:chromosome segregation ATPase